MASFWVELKTDHGWVRVLGTVGDFAHALKCRRSLSTRRPRRPDLYRINARGWVNVCWAIVAGIQRQVVETILHPAGKCRCHGEGRCEWCRRECPGCGAPVIECACEPEESEPFDNDLIRKLEKRAHERAD